MATKLTQTPADIGADDIAALRAAGLDDRAIHDVVHVTGYFAYVNRLTLGLGVTLEDPSHLGHTPHAQRDGLGSDQ